MSSNEQVVASLRHWLAAKK